MPDPTIEEQEEQAAEREGEGLEPDPDAKEGNLSDINPTGRDTFWPPPPMVDVEEGD